MKFFVSVCEVLGVVDEEVIVLDGVMIVGDVWVWLCVCGGVWVDMFVEGCVLCMVCNYEMIDFDMWFIEGCEVVFFLLVMGG